uniref:Uncharacterized protein n=1 Tax=Utricularia reniformis TaxID=192314 RepID=A0A1Y0B325_9LAMI|nr:hypothetical protein AEK19_MT1601 [Utricularia reniformis]ART31783.1 hypothetical protein AEK19_MT1601 [Utricularia reniformis]
MILLFNCEFRHSLIYYLGHYLRQFRFSPEDLQLLFLKTLKITTPDHTATLAPIH